MRDKEEDCWFDRIFAPRGIPYYLPRPYLMVTKNLVLTAKTETETTVKKSEDGKQTETNTVVTTTGPTAQSEAGDTYTCEIVYLPDLNEKYLLRFNRGAGTQENSFTLQDGWKLTGINTKADAETAETITAVATVMKELANLAKNAAVSSTEGGKAAVLDSPKKVTTDKQAGVWLYDLTEFGKGKMQPKCVWKSDALPSQKRTAVTVPQNARE
jgi:hypothetical protein